MEAPKCRICGVRHWGTACQRDNKSQATPTTQAIPVNNTPANSKQLTVNDVNSPVYKAGYDAGYSAGLKSSGSPPKSGTPVSRKTYMRDYMKRYRAGQTVNKPSP